MSLLSMNSRDLEEYWETKVLQRNGLSPKRVELEQYAPLSDFWLPQLLYPGDGPGTVTSSRAKELTGKSSLSQS